VLCNAADGAIGIFAQYQDSPSILGNNLRYMGAHGIHCMDVSDPVINGNTVLGQQSAKHGIYLEASATGAVVVGNVVEGFNGPGGSGIAAANRIGGVVSANLVRRCETGMNLSGCTDMSVTGNSAMSCGTGYSQARGSGMLLASNASAG